MEAIPVPVKAARANSPQYDPSQVAPQGYTGEIGKRRRGEEEKRGKNTLSLRGPCFSKAVAIPVHVKAVFFHRGVTEERQERGKYSVIPDTTKS